MPKPPAPSAAALAADLRIRVGQLRRRLRDEGKTGDLSASQRSVLSHLEREGPATVTTLAKVEGVRPQSMGATVASLQAAGLVSGTPDPADGRQIHLAITPACRKLIKASRAAREDWLLHAIEERLSATEQAQLARAIELLKRLVET